MQLAARCRRMAGLCSTVAIARKFEALALDYEEYAQQVENRLLAIKARGAAAAPPKSNVRVAGDAVAPAGSLPGASATTRKALAP
jgi:hypothetical protein